MLYFQYANEKKHNDIMQSPPRNLNDFVVMLKDVFIGEHSLIYTAYTSCMHSIKHTLSMQTTKQAKLPSTYVLVPVFNSFNLFLQIYFLWFRGVQFNN